MRWCPVFDAVESVQSWGGVCILVLSPNVSVTCVYQGITDMCLSGY
jgi:hypothetical protein